MSGKTKRIIFQEQGTTACVASQHVATFPSLLMTFWGALREATYEGKRLVAQTNSSSFPIAASKPAQPSAPLYSIDDPAMNPRAVATDSLDLSGRQRRIRRTVLNAMDDGC
mmetsp:Transcript_48842/g.129013  ORF Transcript_48842/g.129013 Transcript_48842/m.129013 type:complete len:111 (-) Transcript_48842:71-403(-)